MSKKMSSIEFSVTVSTYSLVTGEYEKTGEETWKTSTGAVERAMEILRMAYGARGVGTIVVKGKPYVVTNYWLNRGRLTLCISFATEAMARAFRNAAFYIMAKEFGVEFNVDHYVGNRFVDMWFDVPDLVEWMLSR